MHEARTGRISEEKAALVLDRAARLDAGGGKSVEIAELREAALEAGISPEAFERALAEVEAISDLPASGTAARAAPAVETPGSRTVRRAAMLATGFALGGLALLLTMIFDDVGVAFSLLMALAVLLTSLFKHRRTGSVLDFEVELGLLWVGLTFLLMFSASPDRVLAVMSMLGIIAATAGAAAITMTEDDDTPKRLPDRP